MDEYIEMYLQQYLNFLNEEEMDLPMLIYSYESFNKMLFNNFNNINKELSKMTCNIAVDVNERKKQLLENKKLLFEMVRIEAYIDDFKN